MRHRRNYPDAYYNLGKFHLQGVFVQQDTQKGIKYLEYAAKNGHANAAFELGEAYSIKAEINGLSQLKHKVSFLGYLPHETIQDEYRKCNVLLLLQNKTDNSKWILPVKFYEYLAANRLILALGERKSDLGDLMNDKDVGEILSYSELGGIRGFIEDVFENDRLPTSKDAKSLLDQFSHEHLVQKLEEILTKCMHS